MTTSEGLKKTPFSVLYKPLRTWHLKIICSIKQQTDACRRFQGIPFSSWQMRSTSKISFRNYMVINPIKTQYIPHSSLLLQNIDTIPNKWFILLNRIFMKTSELQLTRHCSLNSTPLLKERVHACHTHTKKKLCPQTLVVIILHVRRN